jgi:hypothetical protein
VIVVLLQMQEYPFRTLVLGQVVVLFVPSWGGRCWFGSPDMRVKE